ncbi:MAG: roadblock/LC7 domain-containing protein [Myxococcota bacterium]
MHNAQMVIYEAEYQRLTEICEKLLRDSMARAVFLVDKVGQLITSVGQTANIDTTSLASLVAGATAATGGLANLLGEEEFPSHYHQGARDSIYIALIGDQLILTIIFDNRSTEGLVRLRVKRAEGDLKRVFNDLSKKASSAEAKNNTLFSEITDEDIEELFSDTF